ncbi:MAG: caspase family protein [Synechococcus sp.]
MTEESNIPRYYLIACGTSTYSDPSDNRLGVEQEINGIVRIFTEVFGYTQVLKSISNNPDKEFIVEIANWLASSERTEKDVVAFYYSGHGENARPGHCLLLQNSDRDRIEITGLETEKLIYTFLQKDSKVKHILMIIDTCYSGSGSSDMLKAYAEGIAPKQQVDNAFNLHIIASSQFKNTAKVGRFVEAFQIVVDELVSHLDSSYLHPNKLCNLIDSHLGEDQSAQYSCPQGSNPTLIDFFPRNNLRSLMDWESCYLTFVNQLNEILHSINDDILVMAAINTLIAYQKQERRLITNSGNDFFQKLQSYARRAAIDGNCELLIFSEWFCQYVEHIGDLKVSKKILRDIRSWQKNIPLYKPNVNLDCCSRVAEKLISDCIENNKQVEFRIQIELEPESDENNSGRFTGEYALHIGLWMENEDLPLSYCRNIAKLSDSNPQSFQSKLALILPQLIESIHYKILASEDLLPVLELFIPLELYNQSFELIHLQRGREQVGLGEEYAIFINSYERYFVTEFRSIKRKIKKIKKIAWSPTRTELPPIVVNCQTLSEEASSSFALYIWDDCSERMLREIEKNYIFALWSREREQPASTVVADELSTDQWQEWYKLLPNIRSRYRERKQPLQLTHFRDDTFPKPTERSQFMLQSEVT